MNTGRLKSSTVLALALLGGATPAWSGELGTLLRETLDHPAIAAQQQQSLGAQRQLDATTARYFGSGSAGIDAARYEDQRFLGVLSPQALANPAFAREQFRYGASYSLPIDLFGVIAASRQAAEQDLRAAALATRQQTLLKLHETVSAYADLQSLQVQLNALNLQQQRVQTTLERVQLQLKTGDASLTELRLAQSELARVKAEQVRLQGQQEQMLVSLEESAGKRLLPQGQALAVPAWQASEAASSLPAQLAQAQAEAAQAQARAQRRSLWPALSGAADYYEYQGNSQTQDTWSVGARLTLPLDPSAFERSSSAGAQARAAGERSLAQQRQSQRELSALHASYNSALANMQALDEELRYRDQLLAVQEELQRVGAQTVEDSLRHERDRAEAQARLAQARAQAIQAWSAAQVLSGTEPQILIDRLDP